jgi:SAM-dependent methyltransferase
MISRARRSGVERSATTHEHLGELVCPECSAELTIDGSRGSVRRLECGGCKETYPVVDGVPQFARDLDEQAETARSFGFAWKAFWGGFFDKESVFGLKIAETVAYVLSSLGIREHDLKGARILDAGTGSGRIPMVLKDYGCLVYAVDIHDSLGVVSKAIGHASTRFYQADLLKLPFKDGWFDYVWSSGVIMATPDSARAFRSLASKVRPGGTLFVSVYSTALHHYRLFRRFLPFTPHLPPLANYLLAGLIAVPLYAVFNGILAGVRVARRHTPPPYRVLGFDIEDISHKSYRSIVLNLFDQLHPKFQREHSPEEVRQWFESNDFETIVATNVVGMVEMRGVKRQQPVYASVGEKDRSSFSPGYVAGVARPRPQ